MLLVDLRELLVPVHQVVVFQLMDEMCIPILETDVFALCLKQLVVLLDVLRWEGEGRA